MSIIQKGVISTCLLQVSNEEVYKIKYNQLVQNCNVKCAGCKICLVNQCLQFETTQVDKYFSNFVNLFQIYIRLFIQKWKINKGQCPKGS